MKTIFCSSNVEITCVEKITIMGRHSDSFHIQHAIFLRKGISFVMILPHKKNSEKPARFNIWEWNWQRERGLEKDHRKVGTQTIGRATSQQKSFLKMWVS